MIVDGYNSETDETYDSYGTFDKLVADKAKDRLKAMEIAQSADIQGQPTLAEKNIRHVMNNYNPSYKELQESAESALKKSTAYDADSFSAKVHKILIEIEEMLISKNRKYGDAALNPKRVFSRASNIEQINVRIDDKLSRIANQNSDEDEDVDGDLIGYLVLRKIARMK